MLKFLKSLFTANAAGAPSLKSSTSGLQPERHHTVTFSEADVRCERPDGSIECVQWKDLQSFKVVTTDEGPLFPDVFWVLTDSTTECVIPQGATGEAHLMERFQQLPGFDNEALIEAMSSTSNARFRCWQR